MSKVHCGSAAGPGSSGLTLFCTPLVCVLNGLGVVSSVAAVLTNKQTSASQNQRLQVSCMCVNKVSGGLVARWYYNQTKILVENCLGQGVFFYGGSWGAIVRVQIVCGPVWGKTPQKNNMSQWIFVDNRGSRGYLAIFLGISNPN